VASHWNNERYIQWHLTDTESILPEVAFPAFLRGKDICWHSGGIWNEIFLDLFSKETFIRCGKAKGQLV
jgi:hypothetical protein